MYLSLLLFFTSEHWVWELNEDYPVQPVAQMVQEYVPADATVYTSYPHHRPSLNFYSDRQVIPASDAQLRGQWKQEESPYLLVSSSVRESLSLDSVKLLDREIGWQLVTRKSGASEESGDRE
jgi:4-amino-4-deoxy-L-arabinose transferase-like glycosyltransferase